MCGRFANAQSFDAYRQAVSDQLPDGLEPTQAADANHYEPSYNVVPQTRSPVVRKVLSDEEHLHTVPNNRSSNNNNLIMQTMKWGLIPRTQKQYGNDSLLRTINARDDSILATTPSLWHSRLASKRCVVFVQGFYEWQKRDGDRFAHFVGMAQDGQGRADVNGKHRRLMPIAALWEKSSDGFYTFTIVTTNSNQQLGFLHERMPVILEDKKSIQLWLGLASDNNNTWSDQVAQLLRPFTNPLECYRVPREVGKVGNSDPSFILPIENRKDGLKAFLSRHSSPKRFAALKTTTMQIIPFQSPRYSASKSPDSYSGDCQDDPETKPTTTTINMVKASDGDSSKSMHAATCTTFLLPDSQTQTQQQPKHDNHVTDHAKQIQQERDRKLAQRLQLSFDQESSSPPLSSSSQSFTKRLHSSTSLSKKKPKHEPSSSSPSSPSSQKKSTDIRSFFEKKEK